MTEIRTKITPTHLLIVITALAAVLRLYQLGADPLWLDETTTWQLASGPVSVMFSDCHPPLYYLIAKLFIAVLGDSEFVLRLPAVLFGIATVPAIYFAAKESGIPARASLTASLLFAISPWSLWASQEARMYSMVTLAVAVTAYAYLRCRRDPSGANQYLLGIAASFALLSHYLAVVFIAAIAFDALRTGNRWVKPLVPVGITLAALSWQIGTETAQYVGTRPFGYYGVSMLYNTAAALSGYAAFGLIFIIAVMLGALTLFDSGRDTAIFWRDLFIWPVIALSVLGYFMQMMPRYAIAALVPWCVMLGALADCRYKTLGAALTILLVACSAFGTAMYYQQETSLPWDKVAEEIGDDSTVCVIPSYESAALEYYSRDMVFTDDITAADIVVVAPSEIYAEWNRSDIKNGYCIDIGSIEVCRMPHEV